jgi:hypothetical protein
MTSELRQSKGPTTIAVFVASNLLDSWASRSHAPFPGLRFAFRTAAAFVEGLVELGKQFNIRKDFTLKSSRLLRSTVY